MGEVEVPGAYAALVLVVLLVTAYAVGVALGYGVRRAEVVLLRRLVRRYSALWAERSGPEDDAVVVGDWAEYARDQDEEEPDEDLRAAGEALAMLSCPWRTRHGTCLSGCREEPACETSEPAEGWAGQLLGAAHEVALAEGRRDATSAGGTA